jgi:predicted AlkP superfamily phosphohydrolase/phosphomutase
MNDSSLVIGWDGAPFHLIKPLIDRGELPNLERIVDNGYFGPLETTPYVMSPCAWSTFLTGKNAGKHGVLDFYSNEFREEKYFREPVNARDRQAREFWELYNDQDRSVGTINIPVTYPAADMDQFQISGVLAPSVYDDNFVTPDEFLSDFDSLDEYLIDLDMGKDDDKDEFLAKIQKMVEKRTELIKYAIRESDDIDVLLALFTSPDRLSHYFWHFHDESHPYRETESEEDLDKYQNALTNLFKTLDDELGEIRETFEAEYGSNTNIAVVSDHGMDSLETMFFVNEWLSRNGYLTFKDDPEEFDSEELPSEKEYVFGNVDWENTDAYSIGKAGEIYINLEGREPTGSVSPEDYDEVRESIIDDLESLTDPSTGENVTESIQPRENLFEGPLTEKAPDIFVTLSDGCYSLGYLYNERMFQRNNQAGAPFVTGIEDKPGIMCQSGPAFRDSEDQVEMGLADYFPTLMHAMGLDIPEDLDGRVAEELLADSYRENQVVYREGQEMNRQTTEDDSETADSVKDRLEDLGYL